MTLPPPVAGERAIGAGPVVRPRSRRLWHFAFIAATIAIVVGMTAIWRGLQADHRIAIVAGKEGSADLIKAEAQAVSLLSRLTRTSLTISLSNTT